MKDLDKDKYFEEYNFYHDRGIMKWQTAYSMEELTARIVFNHQKALEDFSNLKKTPTKEKEQLLKQALENHQRLSLQTTIRDEFGKRGALISTYFLGAIGERLFFSFGELTLEEIYHLQLEENLRWFEKKASF